MPSLNQLSGIEIRDKIRTQEISSEDIVLACFKRINDVESKINAFTEVFEKEAVKRAKEIDKKIKKGEKVGNLAGIPLAVKDLISVKGHQTSAGSKMLNGYISPYDSTVIERLVRKQDAIIIGTTNMDEFAMGSSTESSFYGATYNPWNLKFVPGGSSGGSGAAIAADETILSLGSDTGGSIRCPAAYCGVAGIKPTYGRVSRYGIIAYANSLEQVGPISKTVKDSALVLQNMAGKDPKDATTVDESVENYLDIIENGIEDFTIGIPNEFYGEGLDPDVEKQVRNAIKILEKKGSNIIKVSLPHIEYALPTYYLIAMSEASSNLARFDGIRYGYKTDNTDGNFNEVFSRTRGEGFGPEVRRRIILGTYALSAGYFEMFYIKALKVRTLIRQDFLKAYEKCDVLIGPTMPATAFEIGTKLDDPIQMYLEDILTVPINLAGIPSMSLNCGFASNGMPVGMQIMGKFFKESDIFRTAYVLEQEMKYFKQRPDLGGY
ncbi:MAG: Asp-tRNA(Asn)/Glu-tRNA(Gln) amidotransferase subunit GatA [Candidatus Lokiarchaeota archaeon]|nr:Asp-tRNA(Asn)/Glu-tRNA(Gln) amidotransferase subunit GatA [Candidatus Lokiarchaeota archaeon]